MTVRLGHGQTVPPESPSFPVFSSFRDVRRDRFSASVTLGGTDE